MDHLAVTPLLLCDVSEWQGPIDWKTLALKCAGVIIKLTEGITYVDPRGASNWLGSRGLLPRGAYSFFHPELDGVAQAQALLTACNNDFGELPLSVDVETHTTIRAHALFDDFEFIGSLPKLWVNTLLGNLHTCLAELENVSGRRPMIYTGTWFAPYLGNPGWLANYDLWLNNFTIYQELHGSPILPPQWDTYRLWQYGSKGHGPEYGVSSVDIDRDVFNGDQAAFAVWSSKKTTMASIHITDGKNSIDFPPTATVQITYIPDTAPPTEGSWTASFFRGDSLPSTGTAPLFSTTYPATFDLNWGNGSPSPLVPVDHFVGSFVKSQNILGDVDIEWTFIVDDGLRFYIDDVKVLDAWKVQAPTTYKCHAHLPTGIHNFKIEYWENDGGARLAVSSAPYTGPPVPPPPSTQWTTRELGVHKMGEGLAESLSALFINNNLEAIRVANTAHYAVYRHWPANSDPVAHARSFNNPLTPSERLYEQVQNELEAGLGRQAGESWDHFFQRLVAYEQAFVRTRYNENGSKNFMCGCFPSGNPDITDPACVQGFKTYYAPWINSQAIDGHPVRLMLDYHSYEPELGHTLLGPLLSRTFAYYPELNDQYERISIMYRKRQLDGTWVTHEATVLKPNDNLRGLSQLHNTSPNLVVTPQDWFETRWHWFLWLCGVDPRIQLMAASETGKDTGGQGGFNLPGIGQQDFISWCIKFLDISLADVVIPSGETFVGTWPSPWKFGDIFQYSGDPSWATYNITQLMIGFPLGVLIRPLP